MADLNHPARILIHSRPNPACGQGIQARPVLAALFSCSFPARDPIAGSVPDCPWKKLPKKRYLLKKVVCYGWTRITEDFYSRYKRHSA